MANSYDSPKSPRGPEPRIDPKSDFKSRNQAKSRQEQFTGAGKRKGMDAGDDKSGGKGMRYSETDRQIGDYVRIAANTKGTDTLKDPLNAYQRAVKPAVENPDGERQKNAKGYSVPKAAPRNLGKPKIGSNS